MRIFAQIFIFLLFISIFLPGPVEVLGHQEVIGGIEPGQEYLVRLSGTVLDEKFDGVKALLKIASPTPGSLNDFLVIIAGFPTTNGRNSFFWNSDETEMITV